jgi:hypothetical protein
MTGQWRTVVRAVARLSRSFASGVTVEASAALVNVPARRARIMTVTRTSALPGSAPNRQTTVRPRAHEPLVDRTPASATPLGSAIVKRASAARRGLAFLTRVTYLAFCPMRMRPGSDRSRTRSSIHRETTTACRHSCSRRSSSSRRCRQPRPTRSPCCRRRSSCTAPRRAPKRADRRNPFS